MRYVPDQEVFLERQLLSKLRIEQNVPCACAYFSVSAKKSACRVVNENSRREIGRMWGRGPSGGRKGPEGTTEDNG